MSDNELIAAFMDIPTLEDYKGIMWDFQRTGKQIYSIRSDELRYDTSWDWLMPVVEKIETEKFSVMIIGKYTRIQRPHPYKEFATDICDSKIQSAYKAVVEFIKWYNQQTK